MHENLKITNMTRRPRPRPDGNGGHAPNGAAAKSGLNKSIYDVGWGIFLRVLSAKAESAGRHVIAVDPRYTSQRCAECGYVAPGNRATQAEFRCLACGHQAHEFRLSHPGPTDDNPHDGFSIIAHGLPATDHRVRDGQGHAPSDPGDADHRGCWEREHASCCYLARLLGIGGGLGGCRVGPARRGDHAQDQDRVAAPGHDPPAGVRGGQEAGVHGAAQAGREHRADDRHAQGLAKLAA